MNSGESSDTRAQRIFRVVELGGLASVLLLGAALRFHLLGYRGLWNDEVVSIQYWSGSIADVVANVAARDIHPPLWFLVVNLFSRLGDSDFVFRLPSAIAGTLTLLAIYHLGTRLFSRRVGLTVTLLMSISSFHLYYSQEARMYALYGLLSVTTTWLLWMASERGKAIWWLGFAVVSTLNLYTHYFAFLLLAVQCIFAGTVLLGARLRCHRGLLCERFAFGRWKLEGPTWQIVLLLLCLAAIGVGYLPWLGPLRDDVRGLASGRGIGWGYVGTSPAAIREYLMKLVLLLFTGYDAHMIPWHLALLGAGGAFALLSREFRQMFLLLLVAGIPLAFKAVTGHSPHPRYFMFAFPFFLLLVARGFVGAGQALGWLCEALLDRLELSKSALRHILRDGSALAVSCLALLFFLRADVAQLRRYYEYDMLGSWRQIGEFLTANALP